MKTLILAPHPDDEVIGCYSIVTDTKRTIHVAFGEYETSARGSEAEAAASALNVKLVSLQSVAPASYDEVYVPSLLDDHPDHKRMNLAYRSTATHFYSVDMRGKRRSLGTEHAERKLALLNGLYPSQRSLWDSDASYYLFESIARTDYMIFADATLNSWRRPLVCRIPAESATQFGKWDTELNLKPIMSVEAVFNVLVSRFGCTSVTDGSITYSF